MTEALLNNLLWLWLITGSVVVLAHLSLIEVVLGMNPPPEHLPRWLLVGVFVVLLVLLWPIMLRRR